MKDETNLMQMQSVLKVGKQEVLQEDTNRIMEAATDDENDAVENQKDLAVDENDAAETQYDVAIKPQSFDDFEGPKFVCCCKENEPMQQCLTGDDKAIKASGVANKVALDFKKGAKTDATRILWKDVVNPKSVPLKNTINICCKPFKNSIMGCKPTSGYPKSSFKYRLLGTDYGLDPFSCRPSGKNEATFDYTCPASDKLKCDGVLEKDVCDARTVKSLKCKAVFKVQCLVNSVAAGFNEPWLKAKSTTTAKPTTTTTVTTVKGNTFVNGMDSNLTAGLDAMAQAHGLNNVVRELVGKGHGAVFAADALVVSGTLQLILSTMVDACTNGASCATTGTGVFNIAVGITAIVFTLTGLPVPPGSVTLTSAVISTVGANMCKNGVMKVIKDMFNVKDLWESVKGFFSKNVADKKISEIVKNGAAALAGIVVSVVKNLVQTIWSLVKGIIMFIPNLSRGLLKFKANRLKAKEAVDKKKEAEYINNQCCEEIDISNGLITAEEILNDNEDPNACWQRGFTKEQCCSTDKTGDPDCWDADHTYEKCCKKDALLFLQTGNDLPPGYVLPPGYEGATEW